MREKAIKIKRKRCASDWFLDIFKVVFLVLVTVICDSWRFVERSLTVCKNVDEYNEGMSLKRIVKR